MRKQGTVNFVSAKSMRFEGCGQLVRPGLMRTEEACAQSLHMTQAARAQQRAAGAA